ncbi:response regulator transcription factor [Catenuloplanes atrovinosus]|uniref:DNA-binding NarL/FixJ family response regulator n=1 Tax=Catenuloplanes atrovinosus TaxID=137266 RepID=A0AAE4CA54_9ACTN|nr:response regulator transcription factor [Catenuloplanes atrovinosus]MDR7276703.1 DNA-binding NarL/FixJ family response regulator [Catenuloplanes atrovinosus]
MISVFVADAQPLQRLGLRVLLENTLETEIVGEAETGAETVRRITELRPDVVLMDIRMPGVDGIETTRRIVATSGRSRVLVLTASDSDRHAFAALRAGASGLLHKDVRPEELLAGIRAVAAGDAVIAPALTRRLLDAVADRLDDDLCEPGPQDHRLDFLTDREREILVAIGHGLTNGEIAQRFTLSESTVKTHVGRVLAKIGARDRIQAVIFAYDLRLTRPAPHRARSPRAQAWFPATPPRAEPLHRP